MHAELIDYGRGLEPTLDGYTLEGWIDRCCRRMNADGLWYTKRDESDDREFFMKMTAALAKETKEESR